MENLQVIDNVEYKKISAKGVGDACKLCDFYDVIMTPFRTQNICARPKEANCETPESVYFEKTA